MNQKRKDELHKMLDVIDRHRSELFSMSQQIKRLLNETHDEERG